MKKHSTDEDWEQWGALDPYYGVLTAPEYRRQQLDRNRERFFETGRGYVHALLDNMARLYPGVPLLTGVDFGCGVGRLAIPLARVFQRVIGADISPSMLSEASANSATFNIANIDFVLSDETLSRIPGGVQFVHSFIVMQHIPVDRGLRIIRDLTGRLAPGGVAAIHVPIEHCTSVLHRAMFFSKEHFPVVRYALKLLQQQRSTEPPMQMNPYPIREISEIYEEGGLEDLWLQPVLGRPLGVIFWGRKKEG